MVNRYSFLTSLFTLLLLGSGLTSRSQISTFPYSESFGSSGCGLPSGYSNSGSDPWDFQNTSESYMEGLDHTSNGGCFASMDDSGLSQDDSCMLTTPAFDLTGIPGAQLRFWWQNSNSTSSQPAPTGPRPWSNLYVDISTNGGSTWTSAIWQVEDSQQVGWTEAIVDLSSYVSSSTVIRFRGLETQSFYSDMSLDDIFIWEPPQYDAKVNEILTPVSGGCGDAAAAVEVVIQNNGTDTITSLPIYYRKDASTIEGDTITATIPPNATYNHIFSHALDLSSPGNASLKVFTALPLDQDASNDTVSNVITVSPTVSSYPYYEDFEAGPGGWVVAGVNSTWAFGTPNKAIIQGAASGSNAFVNGGLTGTYNTSENSTVTGPCFDFSTPAQGQRWVALDVWWDAETSWDGAVLQYTVDDGATWKNVGNLNDPYNWYTDGTINGNPGGQQVGWSGTSSSGSLAWVSAKHLLPDSLEGLDNVIFRIAFGSDASIVDDGFAFDNFAIVDYAPVDLGPDQVSLCGSGQTTLRSNAISWGDHLWSTTETSDSIVVSAQGQYWVQFEDTILNFTSSDSIGIIQTAPPSINFASTIDTILLNGSITLDPQLPFDLDYMWTPGNYTFPYLLVKGADYGLGTHVFNLMVTDSVLCTDQTSVIVEVIDVTGLGESEQDAILVYPNPVKTELIIQLSEPVPGGLIQLFNLQGQLIQNRSVNGNDGQNIRLNMTGREPGYYTLVISANGQRMVSRIIKE